MSFLKDSSSNTLSEHSSHDLNIMLDDEINSFFCTNIFKSHSKLRKTGKKIAQKNCKKISKSSKRSKFSSKKQKKSNKKRTSIQRCPICNEKFSNFCSLGGHIAKNHPGSSDIFKRKNEIHKLRKIERERICYIKKEIEEKTRERD